MAYKRSAPKPDIRHLPVTALPKRESSTQESKHETPTDTLTTHDLSAEFKAIAWCSLPLVALLAVASYWDATHPWVIRFATSLLSIGS